MRDDIKSELLRDAREMSPDHLPRFLGDLEEIRCTAQMQLRSASKMQPEGDDLLVSLTL